MTQSGSQKSVIVRKYRRAYDYIMTEEWEISKQKLTKMFYFSDLYSNYKYQIRNGILGGWCIIICMCKFLVQILIIKDSCLKKITGDHCNLESIVVLNALKCIECT